MDANLCISDHDHLTRYFILNFPYIQLLCKIGADFTDDLKISQLLWTQEDPTKQGVNARAGFKDLTSFSQGMAW